MRITLLLALLLFFPITALASDTLDRVDNDIHQATLEQYQLQKEAFDLQEKLAEQDKKIAEQQAQVEALKKALKERQSRSK